MDAPYHAGAQALVLQLDVGVPLDAAGFLQVVVELLDLDGAQLFQRRVAQLWNDVVVDVVEIVTPLLVLQKASNEHTFRKWQNSFS